MSGYIRMNNTTPSRKLGSATAFGLTLSGDVSEDVVGMSREASSRSLASFIGLLLIVTASWVLILGETYVLFAVVEPLGPRIHAGDIPSSIAKILLTMGLGAFLVFAMFAMSEVYMRAFQPPRPAS